jgi:predicted nucleic acid-binding protein
MHVLDFSVRNQLRCLAWIRRGATEIVSHASTDWRRCAQLIAKYADLPADFADVTLVAACERLGSRRVATIDSDFLLYRYNDHDPFENVFPL